MTWADSFREVARLTPKEAAAKCRALGDAYASLGDKVNIREAVVLRVYWSLLSEPNAGLLRTVLERCEGLLVQPVAVNWRGEIEAAGLNPGEIQERMIQVLSSYGLDVERGNGREHESPD